jgi:hypothetical protein
MAQDMSQEMKSMWNSLTWYDVGHPKCVCSLCSQPIEENEIPTRFFYTGDLEARFHKACFDRSGLIVLFHIKKESP